MKVQPRLLAPEERALLDLLVSIDFEGAYHLREQALSATVTGRCDCGCPSVEITTADEVSSSGMPHRLAPVEGVVTPVADGPPGEVLLFVDDGKLSYLEYARYSDPAPSKWPSIERVTAAKLER